MLTWMQNSETLICFQWLWYGYKLILILQLEMLTRLSVTETFFQTASGAMKQSCRQIQSPWRKYLFPVQSAFYTINTHVQLAPITHYSRQTSWAVTWIRHKHKARLWISDEAKCSPMLIILSDRVCVGDCRNTNGKRECTCVCPHMCVISLSPKRAQLTPQWGESGPVRLISCFDSIPSNQAAVCAEDLKWRADWHGVILTMYKKMLIFSMLCCFSSNIFIVAH